MKLSWYPVLLALLTVSPAVGTAQQPSSPAGVRDFIADVISNVSDTSLASTIRGLEAFGGRVWNGSNRTDVANWIQQRYLSGGVTDVALSSYSYSGTTQYNVVATIPGIIAPDQEIIIGGHYDAVHGSPGADDNGSGTAAALEAARVLRLIDYTPRATLRFIAFSNEESGLVGSADYAAKAKAAGNSILLMQNYDMIGYRPPSSTDWRIRIVHYSGSEAEASLDSVVMRSYTRLTPVYTTQYWNRSDSYSFWQNGYRAIFSIEDTFNPYYHTSRDSSTYIDFPFVAEVVKSALALLLTVDASVLSASDRAPAAPTSFALEQNYPNPFNPTTSIQYSIPVATYGRTSLRVYDILGREVATLVDGIQSPGRHTATFDAASNASGVYLCRLVAGAESAVRRMILVR